MNDLCQPEMYVVVVVVVVEASLALECLEPNIPEQHEQEEEAAWAPGRSAG